MIALLATRYSRTEVEASLREAREAGITFFDTADVYGQGDSERLLGKLFRSGGEGMILCTKAGLTVGSMEPVVRLAKPVVNSILRRWRTARVATTQVHAAGRNGSVLNRTIFPDESRGACVGSTWIGSICSCCTTPGRCAAT